MKILCFGDIVGRIGRQALTLVLPGMKEELKPDLVIANVENIAHGSGVTRKTLQEVLSAGVNVCTSGNHVLSKPEAVEVLNDPNVPLIRPANFLPSAPGRGFLTIRVGDVTVAVANLVGQVFMRDTYDNPFRVFDAMLPEIHRSKPQIIIVDFHGEVTSEKAAFGWYANGRVTAVVGSHTHVPTADQKILPEGGTAYVTDLGLVGALDSVIGDEKEPIIQAFLRDQRPRIEVPESGPVSICAVLIDCDPLTSRATLITRVDRLAVV